MKKEWNDGTRKEEKDIWRIGIMHADDIRKEPWGGAEAATRPELHAEGEYQYTVLEDGTACIIQYLGRSKVVYIPEKLGKNMVTVIGNAAFQGNLNIETVYFSESIKKTMPSAFFQCKSLRYIYLNNGLEEIGNNCFSECDMFTINIPDSVTKIDTFAFSDNDRLRDIKLPDNVKDIPMNCFDGCPVLEKITLGKKMKQ